MSNSEKPVKFCFVLKTENSRSITLTTTVLTAFVTASTRWYSQTMILDWDKVLLWQKHSLGLSGPCCCDETSPVLGSVTFQSLQLTQVALNFLFVGVRFWCDISSSLVFRGIKAVLQYAQTLAGVQYAQDTGVLLP